MQDSRAFEQDPVERFLESRFPGPVNVELRRTLLGQSIRVLHRRRRWKQISFVAALVGCYLLGLATMQIRVQRLPTTTTTEMILSDHRAGALEKTTIESTLTPNPGQDPLSADRAAEIPAFVLERMAQFSQENQSLLYRRAGDRYLADGDLKSALHCYGRSLDAGSEKDWAVSQDDNWLLIYLKTARQEEKLYAKSAG